MRASAKPGIRLFLAVVLLSSHTLAIEYRAPLPKAEWRLERGPLACRLYQEVPFFGIAEFRQVAGGSGEFRLTSSHPVAEGTAQIRIDSPPWRHQEAPGMLTAVPVFASTEPIVLESTLSEQLLTALYSGMMPVFAGLPWLPGSPGLDVALPSVNFQRAYHDYRDCVVALIPATFADVERSRIGFALNQWRIGRKDQERLDLLIRYIRADEFVTGVYVDGYTDDLGRRRVNRELSKRRAEAVTKYLVARGVPAEMITTRYHGEAFPLSKSKDEEGRALNRRVTVRLERY